MLKFIIAVLIIVAADQGVKGNEVSNITSEDDEDGMCYRNGQYYPVGLFLDFNLQTNESKCMRCTCNMPPDFTCVYKTCPPPPNAFCKPTYKGYSCCPDYECNKNNGVAAEDDDCEGGLQRCSTGDAPEKLPETAEDLENACNFGIPYFECALDYEERCYGESSYIGRVFLDISREVCNEDTLLHAAVVDNLKCFADVVKKSNKECDTDSELVSKFAESLSEDGILTLPEDEWELDIIHGCIQHMLDSTCYASKIETECGTVAKDAFVEIATKLGPAFECPNSDTLIPEFFRRYRWEEEDTNAE